MIRRSPIYERFFPRNAVAGRHHFARELKKNRKRGRDGDFYQGRGLHDYEAHLGFKSGGIVERISMAIQKRKRPICILDAGCGKGIFLSALKGLYRDTIITTGLNSYRSPRPNGIDHFRTGAVERFSDQSRYDFIFSVYAFMYATSPEAGVHNLIRALRPGGEAFIDLDETRLQLKRLSVTLRHEYPDFYFRLHKKMFSRTYLHVVRR